MVAKAQPKTTMPYLLNNFYFLHNLYIQTKPNNNAKTEEKTFNFHNCCMRNRCRLEQLVICFFIFYEISFLKKPKFLSIKSPLSKNELNISQDISGKSVQE